MKGHGALLGTLAVTALALPLVRITLKKAYTDGTIAVDMDPLSLLCRLATSVPPPPMSARLGVSSP